MARGAVSVIGASVAASVAALVLLPLVAVIWRAGAWPALAPGDGQALWFTLWQAVISALLSCLLAVPVARALARRRFLGRAALITLMGAPFLLPTIVAVMGLIAVGSLPDDFKAQVEKDAAHWKAVAEGAKISVD